MNDEAVYRTAPATPGLLITCKPYLDYNEENTTRRIFKINYDLILQQEILILCKLKITGHFWGIFYLILFVLDTITWPDLRFFSHLSH